MIKTTVVPWFSFKKSVNAIDFYKSAFGAIEVYRMEDPGGGVVTRLSVDGAEFWISEEAGEGDNMKPDPLGGNSVRMILTVQDPDALFARALQAGASEIFPIGEDYGWRLGRLADPFGLHWEIGYPLNT